MIDGTFLSGYELDFLIGIGLSLLAGFLIGAEREARGKAAGISTHCFVIAGSIIFTYLSAHAIIAIAFAVLVPRIPHISKIKDVADR